MKLLKGSNVRKKWAYLKLAPSQKSLGSYAHRADARFTALRRSKGRIAALVKVIPFSW